MTTLRMSIRIILCTALVGTQVLSEWEPYEATPEDTVEWNQQKEKLLRDRERIGKLWNTVNTANRTIVLSKIPRMLFCVTGQASRLELESKVNNVLLTNSEHFRINFFLLLTPADSQNFVNSGTNTHTFMSWNEKSIEKYVRGRMGKLDEFKIKIDIEDQEKNPWVVNKYYQNMDKTGEIALKRLHSHVRQWLTLFRCWSYLVETSKDEPYKVVLRLRDDSFVFQPLRVYSMGYKDWALIPSCLGWGGYNDKSMIFDAKYADTILAKPALVYYFEYDSLNTTIRNPEQYLKAVLTKYHVPVHLVDIDTMPIYTSRVSLLLSTHTPCFIFESVHLGRIQTCYPSACFIRQRILCAACNKSNVSGRLEGKFLHSGLSGQGSVPCTKLSSCPLSFFNTVS